MGNAKRIVLASALVCLAFSMAFSGTSTAAINLPTFVTGDFMEYYMQMGQQNITSGDYTSFWNVTMYYNITDDNANRIVNGTSYSVYIIESSMNGTLWGFDQTYGIITGDLASNSTIYLIKSNLSTIWMYQEMNWSYTSPFSAYMWQAGDQTYLVASDDSQFPINLGEVWYNNCTYFSRSHSKTNMPMTPPESWDNSTSTTYDMYTCENLEPVGTYATYKIKQQDPNDMNATPEYEWVSADAGSAAVMRISNETQGDQFSYQYQILVDGYWNGNDLTGIPIPHQQPQVFEFSVVLLPVAGVAALFIVAGRRK